VDDENFILRMNTRIFMEAGLELYCCKSREELLELLRDINLNYNRDEEELKLVVLIDHMLNRD